MAHLTLGELRPALHAAAGERLAQIQQTPGYGYDALRLHGTVLPRDLADAELLRLRQAEDTKTQGDPLTYALIQLRRAYEDDDIRVIRRWQAAVETAGGRRYLRAIEARNASYRDRGLAGLGNWRNTQRDARYAAIYQQNAIKRFRQQQIQQQALARQSAGQHKRDARFARIQNGGRVSTTKVQSMPGGGRVVCYRPSPYLSGMDCGPSGMG